MRIAIWHGLSSGGAWQALDQLTRQLAARHQVDVFLIRPPEEPSLQLDSARVEIIPFRGRRHIRRMAFWNDWRSVLDLRDIERIEENLARRIDNAGYDVALTSALGFAQAPSLLRFLKTPSAYYCHETLRRFSEPWCRPEAGPMSGYERARQVWRWPAQASIDELIRRRDIASVRRAGVVLTNSRHTQERIRDFYGRDAEVCYLGVDAGVFAPAKGAVPPRQVMSAGVMQPHKGFDFVIRALGRIPPQNRPGLTLVGGSGQTRIPAYLERLAQRVGVSLHIRLNVPLSELVAHYQSHALFVFGALFEPFGLVLLEAMACGLPVVAVAEGGVPESVLDGSTGLLAPRDEAAFGSAVSRLLGDEALRRRMGQAAREHAQQWTWEAAGRRVESHLEKLASTGRRTAAAGVAIALQR